MLKYGSYRITEVFDDYVIKYPMSTTGATQNKEEYEKYLKNPDVFAKCELLPSGDLKMEKLDVQTEYVMDQLAGDAYACNLYDNMTCQTLHCNCNKDCASCQYAKKLEYDLTNLIPHKINDKLQVGYDKNGVLKFYDFPDTNLKFEKPFKMRVEYEPLFYEYLQTDRSISFVKWIQSKELPQYTPNNDEIYKHANKIKRRMYLQK